jgi:glycosyltransferase involved in cell wall biosynthesis
LIRFAASVEAAVAHSHFSAGDLHRAGYGNVEVIPYAIWEKLYETSPDQRILDLYQRDGRNNLLVVGRIMPHKCVEDSLFVLDYLRKQIGSDWRLILVGSSKGAETYRERIVSLAERMDLRDVVWAGAVSQAALSSFYKLTNAFLLMSEHEGFGVPLVEAMRYDVPIFAYANAAVPEVMGDSGVLFDEKNWPLIAETIHMVNCDPQRKAEVLQTQRVRRDFFSHSSAEQRWRKWLTRFS